MIVVEYRVLPPCVQGAVSYAVQCGMVIYNPAAARNRMRPDLGTSEPGSGRDGRRVGGSF